MFVKTILVIMWLNLVSVIFVSFFFLISNHQSIQNGSEMLVKTSHYVFLNLCVNSLMGGTSQVLLSSKHGLFLSATWFTT